MNDNANPRGIERPRLATKKVYQDDPKSSRPILPIRSRRGTPAVAEGNDPRGIARPRLDTKPSPYDQDMDPDD